MRDLANFGGVSFSWKQQRRILHDGLYAINHFWLLIRIGGQKMGIAGGGKTDNEMWQSRRTSFWVRETGTYSLSQRDLTGSMKDKTQIHQTFILLGLKLPSNGFLAVDELITSWTQYSRKFIGCRRHFYIGKTMAKALALKAEIWLQGWRGQATKVAN